jgi:hypothetical protein
MRSKSTNSWRYCLFFFVSRWDHGKLCPALVVMAMVMVIWEGLRHATRALVRTRTLAAYVLGPPVSLVPQIPGEAPSPQHARQKHDGVCFPKRLTTPYFEHLGMHPSARVVYAARRTNGIGITHQATKWILAPAGAVRADVAASITCNNRPSPC